MAVTTMTNLGPASNPKRTGRRAQPWAQQFLAALKEDVRADTPLPKQITMKGSALTLPRGTAIRWSQETNLAIKQHNEGEQQLADERIAAQVREAKNNKSGTVTIPDYVPEFIYWRVRAQISEGECNENGEPLYHLYADMPSLDRNRSRVKSSLSILADQFFTEKMAELKKDNSEPKEDPYEKMLRG